MNEPQERFTGLYDRYYPRVLRYALQHADPGSAEDVASETFLVAWRRLAELPQPPLPWLLAFNFASPADKARWQAAGSPKLANPSGNFGYTGPVTSNYDFGGYSYNIGAIKVSLAKARTLPTAAAALDAFLRVQWDNLSAKQKAATIGLPNPSYTLYLFQVAGALLTGPVTPGTRAAVYRLLAVQPGLMAAANVTDPLGRVGTAVGDGDGNYLIIDPATAKVLAMTTYPVHPGSTIPATAGGTEAYEAMGWTNQLGIPAGS